MAGRSAVESPAVVPDREDDRLVAVLERKLDAASVGVPERVRQALLGDPIDHELLVAVEGRQVAGNPALDARTMAFREPCAKGRQRARKAEIVERLRSELASHVANVLEAAAGRFPRVPERLLQLGGDTACDVLDL